MSEDSIREPLCQWLLSRRWIRPDSTIIPEFPWSGRRIDLAILTKSGTSSAFELKVANVSKVLYQASLNCHVFDRSSIVVASLPSDANLLQAEQLGLGVLLIDPKNLSIRSMLSPRNQFIDPIVKSRLRSKLLHYRGKSDV